MGGSDDPENLVEVTVEEHANLHKQLWEELGHWQDYVAWQGLSGRMDKEELIREAQLRANIGRVVSIESRKKMSLSHRGKKQSKETIEKRVQKLRGQKREFSQEWKTNISNGKKGTHVGQNNPFYGKKHKEETLEKNRKAHIGHTYNRGRKFDLTKCPHCDKIGAINAMGRYHFENCKKKVVE